MSNDTVVLLAVPARVSDPLRELLRSGARRLLEVAVSAEFEQYLSGFVHEKLPDGVKRQRLVRNGQPSDPLIAWLKPERARVPADKREPTLAERCDVSHAAPDQGAKRQMVVGGHRLVPLPPLAGANGRTHPHLAQFPGNRVAHPPNFEQLPGNRAAHPPNLVRAASVRVWGVRDGLSSQRCFIVHRSTERSRRRLDSPSTSCSRTATWSHCFTA